MEHLRSHRMHINRSTPSSVCCLTSNVRYVNFSAILFRVRYDSAEMQQNVDQLQVFISSVMRAEDVFSESTIVHDAISSLHLTRPWAFEFSPARADPPDTVYLEEVWRSDLLVCIVSRTHSPAVQAELEAAENANVRILAFVRQSSRGSYLWRKGVKPSSGWRAG